MTKKKALNGKTQKCAALLCDALMRFMVVGTALLCTLPLLAAEVYVNANTGSDTEHGGTSPSDAYQSLTKAMEGRASGDVVHAAAGIYRTNSATAPDGYSSRVVVPAGVTLVGDGNGETVIEGESGMRCVWLTGGSTPDAGAKLKGFTVRGGYITDTSGTHYGAGVASAYDTVANRHKAVVEDCLITANTNNYRGAGISCVIARRCRIMSNKATQHGSAAYYGMLYNCIIDNNDSGYATCFTTPMAVNCTFGPGNNQRGFHSADATCKNCIFLGIMINDASKFTFDHCAFASDATGMAVTEENIGTGSYFVPAAQIRLTEDYAPIVGACVAVDSGDNSAVDGDKDVYGNARIYNGVVDMGAVEAGASLSIEAADGGISVTGAQIGVNALSETPITVTVTRTFDSHYGCCGIRFNGELIRFGEGNVGESWTHEFSSVDGSPSIVAVYEKVWYVDANIVQEAGKAYDGRSKARAFKTLKAAMENELLASGDEVRALAGTYDLGTMVSGDDVESRVVVKAGVLLAAAGTADETVIKGGANVRCVWLEEGATVRGFTVTGANLDSTLASGKAYGGGVGMQDGGVTRNKAFVEDCHIVSNKVYYRGGGVANVIVRRSLILDNESDDNSAASFYGALYDSVVDGHKSTGSCTQRTTPIVNCTFGPNNGVRSITKDTNIFVTNTLFMSEFQPGFVVPGYVAVDHCIFATNNASGSITTASANSLDGTNSRRVDYRDVKLKGDYTVRLHSAAIDAGDSSVAGEKDVYGGIRVCGSAVDVGASEFDPADVTGLILLFR